MADQHRTSPESLARLATLQNEPYRYTLLSAIRMLDCVFRDPAPTGKSNRPINESLRLGQRPSLNFAPSSLASFQRRNSDGKWQLQTSFLGVFGPNGPMPTHITDFADQRLKHHRDPTFAAFVDLFHHRMASFFLSRMVLESTDSAPRSSGNGSIHRICGLIVWARHEIVAKSRQDAGPCQVFFCGPSGFPDTT